MTQKYGLSSDWISRILHMGVCSLFCLFTAVVWWLIMKDHQPTIISYYVITAILFFLGALQPALFVRVEEVQIKIKNLPEEFENFKIAMMSDLHVGKYTRIKRLRQFTKIINQHQPNMLALCGDLVQDDSRYVKKLLDGLENLSSEIVTFAVLGNHDVYANPFKIISELKKSKIILLVNSGGWIKKNDEMIWICGVGDFSAKNFEEYKFCRPNFSIATLTGKPRTIPVIMLCHQPKGFKNAISWNIDLMLSGHTHGGQLGFKKFNWSLARLFTKYHMGLFKEGDSQLYVSSGTGSWGLPIRIGLSPEITMITLVKG